MHSEACYWLERRRQPGRLLQHWLQELTLMVRGSGPPTVQGSWLKFTALPLVPDREVWPLLYSPATQRWGLLAAGLPQLLRGLPTLLQKAWVRSSP